MHASTAAVLDALRPAGPLTAGEVMEITGLSRPTVHAAGEELIRLGWAVEREGHRPGDEPRTGRPARLYEFHATAGYALAVDLGVHTARAMVTDLRGDSVGEASTRLRAPRTPADEWLDAARSTAAEAVSAAGVPPAAILTVGLGVPAAVDGLTGHARVDEGYLPGLAALDLRETFTEPFGRAAHVDNDANLAALAERWRGAAAGADDAVVLLAGERLGAGLVLGGALVRGRHGGAGEMRFLDLVPGVAATGIATWARVLGARAWAGRAGDTSVPSAAEIAGGGPRAEDVFAAARTGAAWATDVVEVVAEKVATALAPVVTLLDPGLAVISGAVAASCDVLLPGLEARLSELAPWPIRIAASQLGDGVVVTGAVRLALDQLEDRLRR